MSIPNYIRPQLTIKQLLDITTPAEADRINATVIGPRFLLSRYGKEETPSYVLTTDDIDTDTAGVQLPYQYLVDGVVTNLTDEVVDQDSVSVHVEGLEAILAALDNTSETDTDGTIATLNAAGTIVTLQTGSFRGNDLRSEFDDRDVVVGDKVYVEIDSVEYVRTVAAFSADNAIQLNGAVPSGLVTGLTFVYVYTGALTKTTHYTVGASSVTVLAGLSLTVAGKTTTASVDTATGSVYVSFRAFVPASTTDTYVSISSTTDIENYLGPVDLDNDIAYAASRALVGSQGKRIYALRVVSNDLAGFTAALRKIEATDYSYALAAITEDLSVQDAVATHVAAMSTDVKKNFRRAYIGLDSPGEYSVLTGKEFTAATYNGKADSYITITYGGLINAGVVAGYKFRVASTDYEIASVMSDTELILGEVGPGASGTAAIYAADTVASQTKYIQNVAEGFGSRRCVVVWCENGTDYIDAEYKVIPNKFVAAEIAGIRSALPPQAGLTRTEVTTITDAPAMHSRYTPDELDAIAAAGVFVVTQDVESGAVFIRHQLTTKTDSGSLYYEDSVGVNIDDISFAIKDAVGGFIGKKNVTPQTLAEIQVAVRNLLQGKAEADADAEYGPQIISFRDLVVRAHPTLKDRVEINVVIEVPLPMNNIDVYLNASVGLTI